jgi:hypothetical protein
LQKKLKNPTQQQKGHNPGRICAHEWSKKGDKNAEFGGGWFCEKMRKKWRNEGDGGDGTAGGGDGQWCGDGVVVWWSVWVVDFGGVWKKRKRRWGRGSIRHCGEMREERGK